MQEKISYSRNQLFLSLGKSAIVFSALYMLIKLLEFNYENYFAIDFFDEIFDKLRYYRRDHSFIGLLTYLTTPHNEHIIAITRLIAIADDFLCNGRERLQIVLSYCFQFLSVILIYRTIIADRSIESIINKIFIFFCIEIFFFNGNFLANFTTPFQIEHFIMGFLAVLSAKLFSDIAAIEKPNDKQMYLFVARMAGLAAIATVNLGNAPVLLIATAAGAFILRWPKGWTLLIAGLAAIHIWVILSITHSDSGYSSHNIFTIAKFALLYLGAPFMRLEDPWPASYATWWESGYLGLLFGIILAGIAGGFGVMRWARPGWGGRTAMFGLILMIVVIVTAAAAGYSRAGIGILEAASKKYASFAALAWAGAFMIVIGTIRSERFPKAGLAGIVIMLFLIIPLSWVGQNREMRIWAKAVDGNWEAALASYLSVNDEFFLQRIYQVPYQSEIDVLVNHYLEPNDLGIFSYYPFHWGSDVKDYLGMSAAGTCKGTIDMVQQVPAADIVKVFNASGTLYRLQGWTWLEQSRAPARDIVMIDDDSYIVGLGRTTRTSAIAEEWLGQKFERNLGWYGFIRTTKPGRVRLFGRSTEGDLLCPLGEINLSGD